MLQRTAARFYEQAAQQVAPGVSTWISRGANFVVAVSRVQAGARLDREADTDESMVYLFDMDATVEAGGEQVQAQADSVTIVPPGASRITAHGSGLLVRVFCASAGDLAALADNAATYATHPPEVAPLLPWPDPPGGFRLRHYKVSEHTRPDSNMRIFRSTRLMLNVLTPRQQPRDVHKLSPHSHADFEQGSLALSGDWVHHMRYPWTPDMTTWQEDEHIELASPSLLVVPPKAIHTSRNTNAGGASLLDIFAPPRMDFSSKPGAVANAADYPMPEPGVAA